MLDYSNRLSDSQFRRLVRELYQQSYVYYIPHLKRKGVKVDPFGLLAWDSGIAGFHWHEYLFALEQIPDDPLLRNFPKHARSKLLIAEVDWTEYVLLPAGTTLDYPLHPDSPIPANDWNSVYEAYVATGMRT